MTYVATSSPLRTRIQALHRECASLRPGKESLLAMIDEVEIPESVYNSNAIENSTLTLEDTEKILLEQMLSRNVSVREVFEAVNLARVIEHQRNRADDADLSKERILRVEWRRSACFRVIRNTMMLANEPRSVYETGFTMTFSYPCSWTSPIFPPGSHLMRYWKRKSGRAPFSSSTAIPFLHVSGAAARCWLRRRATAR